MRLLEIASTLFCDRVRWLHVCRSAYFKLLIMLTPTPIINPAAENPSAQEIESAWRRAVDWVATHGDDDDDDDSEDNDSDSNPSGQGAGAGELDPNDPEVLVKRVEALFGDRVCVTFHQPWGLNPLAAPPVATVQVDCGRKSAGLCCVVLRGEKALKRFHELNPFLLQTLVTVQNDLVMCWFRCPDWTPRSFETDQVIWCSDGPVSVIQTGQSIEQQIDATVKIATVNFADFNWDSEAAGLVRSQILVALHGPLIRKITPRRRVLNDATACRLFAESHAVRWDEGSRLFLMVHPLSQEQEHVTESQICEFVSIWLQELADRDASFPKDELRPSRVRTFVKELRRVVEAEVPQSIACLKSFVTDRLCRQAGNSLTADEIYADYFAFARHRSLSVQPLCVIQRELPLWIKKVFGLTRVNNVRRQNAGSERDTARRGYNGLAFKDRSSDGPDVRDGADGLNPNGNPDSAQNSTVSTDEQTTQPVTTS